ncbi:hypothetical protein K491DRAFT_756626 [Lophiostoma macrostomum CBS 122681]|uniref:C3H1-type domain-containing protein n=1 Tax=Lophiostoma macrostomum CBS 122681 TaxID=1314788 RepID=A0A6A6TCI2_9PLEO|nr:hypothetical protein K491DRAFT_756626 [Lophiostoma macrostomum CBS 122681]
MSSLNTRANRRKRGRQNDSSPAEDLHPVKAVKETDTQDVTGKEDSSSSIKDHDSTDQHLVEDTEIASFGGQSNPNLESTSGSPGGIDCVARPLIEVRTDTILNEDDDLDVNADATPDDDLELDAWLDLDERYGCSDFELSVRKIGDEPSDQKLEVPVEKAQSSSGKDIETPEIIQSSTTHDQDKIESSPRNEKEDEEDEEVNSQADLEKESHSESDFIRQDQSDDTAANSVVEDLGNALETFFNDDLHRQGLQHFITSGHTTITHSFTQQGLAFDIAIGVQDLSHERYGDEMGPILESDKKLASQMLICGPEDRVAATLFFCKRHAEALEQGDFVVAKAYAHLLCRISALHKNEPREGEEGQDIIQEPETQFQAEGNPMAQDSILPPSSGFTSSALERVDSSGRQRTFSNTATTAGHFTEETEIQKEQFGAQAQQPEIFESKISYETQEVTPLWEPQAIKPEVHTIVFQQEEQDEGDVHSADNAVVLDEGIVEPEGNEFMEVIPATAEATELRITKADDLIEQTIPGKFKTLRDAPPLEALEENKPKIDICMFDAKCTNKNCRRHHPSRDGDQPDPEQWKQGNEERCKFDEVGCRNKRCGYAHQNPFAEAAALKFPKVPDLPTDETQKVVKCPWINKPQGCRFGEDCNYDHSHKGEKCPKVDTEEGCPDGAWKCIYVHLSDSEQAPAAATLGVPESTIKKAGTRYPNILCRNIQNGLPCKMGDDCYWSHDLETVTASPGGSPSPAPTTTQGLGKTELASSGPVQDSSFAEEAALPPSNAPTSSRANSRPPRTPYVPPKQRGSDATADNEQHEGFEDTQPPRRRSARLNPGIKRGRGEEDVDGQPSSQRPRIDSARSLADRITRGDTPQGLAEDETIEGAPKGPSGNNGNGRGRGRGHGNQYSGGDRGGRRGGRGGNQNERGRGGQAGNRGGRGRGQRRGAGQGGDGEVEFQIKGAAGI